MFNTADNRFHFSRRETLRSVGAAAALAVGTTVVSRTREALAATTSVLHDRISGHAGRVRALDRFLSYAKSKEGVWFARKDEICPVDARSSH